MKLTEKSNEVFTVVKANAKGVTLEELVELLGRTKNSVNASVLDLTKKKLACRKEDEDGVSRICLTEAGETFVPDEE